MEQPQDHSLYTVQHIGTNAEDFTDYVFNICVHEIMDKIPATKASLEEYFSETFSSKEELSQCLHSLVKHFYSTLEINSDVLEKYLEDVTFNFSPNIILPEIKIQKMYQQLSEAVQQDLVESSAGKEKMLIEKLKHLKMERTFLMQSLSRVDLLEIKLNNLHNLLLSCCSQCSSNELVALLKQVSFATKFISNWNSTISSFTT
ncbi:unnamed protein product [Clavelina lepadiformis]|uniref:Uncharacterized protein n=1 Tax=Clavelina lepadiformis TaxID=159417 RepID=A0ABP0GF60_CLALP